MPADSTAPESTCALVVVSCDAYADLWPPFFNLLKRHWPDCPFEVVLGAGPDAEPPLGVRMLRSGAGRDWSRCLMDYLEALPQSHVLIVLEDFFLRRPVRTEKIRHCLKFAQAHRAIQVRLVPRPGPTDPVPGETNIGFSAADSPYRLSTQAAIWDRRKLLALLRPGESIWEFEHRGNDRARQYRNGFFSVKSSVLPYDGFWAHHVVEKGKWIPHEKWVFGRAGVGCDFSRRETLPWRQMAIYHLVQLTMRLLSLLPWRTQVRVKHQLKSVLRPFFHTAMDRLGQTPPASRLGKSPRALSPGSEPREQPPEQGGE